MATFHFKTRHIPGSIVTEDRSARASYLVDAKTSIVAPWAGVIDVSIATDLKPWAVGVRLAFTDYRVGTLAWEELTPDRALWGCLLRGANPRHVALFALIQDDWPVIGKSFGLVAPPSPPTGRE